MVDLEGSPDVEGGTLLDVERLVLEGIHSSGGGQVDHDVVAALDNQRKRLDLTLGIARLANGGSGVQTQGGLPAVQSLVILVCEESNC